MRRNSLSKARCKEISKGRRKKNVIITFTEKQGRASPKDADTRRRSDKRQNVNIKHTECSTVGRLSNFNALSSSFLTRNSIPTRSSGGICCTRSGKIRRTPSHPLSIDPFFLS